MAAAPALSPSPAPVPGSELSPASTVRNRRRRARLRASGIELAYYELPTPIVTAVRRAALTMKIQPSEYVTRILSSDLLRIGALTPATGEESA